jgi:3,4-dihydroxy 2-butanone 4-phosphate synthase/GTP cyclohydrolase II
VRSGHTEGSVDLARLAGREPAGVICEIMRDDGEMARMPDLERFAAEHDLPILSIADLIEYRLSQELLVRRAHHETIRPTLSGLACELEAYVYETDVEETEYLALVLGAPQVDEPTLVRVQSASVLRDVFGVAGDPSSPPATVPLRMIEAEGRGVLLYVFSRGRASLLGELSAAAAQRDGAAPPPGTAEARLRDFGLGAQVLADLGCGKIRLITNHPRRVVGLSGYGLDIVECVPIRAPSKVVALRDRDSGRSNG